MKIRTGIGLLLLLFGVLVLSNALGLTAINPWAAVQEFFWPAVFVVLGLLFLANIRVWSFSRILIGLALLLLGGTMIANHLGLIHLPTHQVWTLFWPVLVILVGFQLLMGARRDGRSWAILSGISRNHPGWRLRNGDFWAILGGVQLDLRKAEIPNHDVTLEITTLLGGVDMIVPEGLKVQCHGTTILGGMHMFGRDHGGVISTHQGSNDAASHEGPTVRVHCTAILGGVKIIARP